MRQFGRPGAAPFRTYGRTAAGFYDRSRNLWAEVEADEEARRRKEEERKIELEGEERRRRKERKAKRMLVEEQERGGLKDGEDQADEDKTVVQLGQVGEFAIGGDELEGGEIVVEGAEVYKGFTAESPLVGVPQPAIMTGAETPPTSPEKDPDKGGIGKGKKSVPPSPLVPPRTPPKSQPLEAAFIPTNRPPSPDSTTSAPVVDNAPNPLPFFQSDCGSDAPTESADNDEASSSILHFHSVSPILTPDRRGGLRRRSSRLTASPGLPMAASPSTVVPRLRLSSSGEEGYEEPGVLVPKQRKRLSSASMVSVTVTLAKTITEVDTGEYEVFHDEDEECEEEHKVVKLSEEHDGIEHNQAGQNVEGGNVEDECSEWRYSSIIQEELDNLLSLCTVNSVLDFTAHITSQLQYSTLSKLGEASYSEVFLQSSALEQNSSPSRTVLKIIPFGHPAQCPVSQIHDELLITVEMSPLPGFIGFQSAHIVRGPYPAELLDLWDYWDQYVKAGGSENDRPDFYSEQQLFVVIGLEDGGIDLEKWSFKGDKDGGGGWTEAREVFWRVAGSLARGEKEREFEHRDLHFGNVVIKRVPTENGSASGAENMMRELTLNDDGKNKTGVAKEHGCEVPKTRTKLQVSLIDYTLSRARCDNEQLRFSPLDDEALFQGRGDYQFDIYRL